MRTTKATLPLALFTFIGQSSGFGLAPTSIMADYGLKPSHFIGGRSVAVGIERLPSVNRVVFKEHDRSFMQLGVSRQRSHSYKMNPRHLGALSAASGENDDDDLEEDDIDTEEWDNDDNEESSNQQSSSIKNVQNGKYKTLAPGERPAWALPWMPTWLITLRPRTQFLLGLCLYVFHLRVLTQYGIPFPFQLIPNDEGWFQSIGLDSVAGMLAFAGLVWLRRSSVQHIQARNKKNKQKRGLISAVPPIWSDPTEEEAPWRLRPREKNKGKKKMSKSEEMTTPHPRSTSIMAFVLLTVAYFSTGRFSILFENGLYAAAGYGLPLTVAMHRSLVVLLGHLTWVFAGSGILAGVLSPKPFFGGGWTKDKSKSKGNNQKTLRPYRWYTNQWDTYWLWWTIGGYFVSAWLFNIADFLNQILLPPALFAQPEGVVSQLINPENNDFLASLVGYIAPCLSAPWWEEVLYRGYLLPALGLFMGFWPSVFVSGVLFSVHHLSVMGAIPLAVLGWVWAVLYAKSGNILVTILIHGMWNSRVFLGSWLGL